MIFLVEIQLTEDKNLVNSHLIMNNPPLFQYSVLKTIYSKTIY